MKKFYLIASILSIALVDSYASLATDSATSYGGAWNSGDNNGTGFTAWTFDYSGGFGTSGQYIKDNSRWALWANSGTVSASRGFTGLQIGDSINFDIEHTPTINGEVGLTLSKNGTDVFNLKFAGGGSSWTVWDSFSGTFGLSQGYEANTPLSFNFEVIGNFEYSLDFGSASRGIQFAGQNIEGIDQITFYNNYQGDSQNFSIGDMSVIPEPATIGLLGFVGSSLVFVRKRFSA